MILSTLYITDSPIISLYPCVLHIMIRLIFGIQLIYVIKLEDELLNAAHVVLVFNSRLIHLHHMSFQGTEASDIE